MYIAIYVPLWVIRMWLWVRRLFARKSGMTTIGWYYLGGDSKLLVSKDDCHRIMKVGPTQ